MTLQLTPNLIINGKYSEFNNGFIRYFMRGGSLDAVTEVFKNSAKGLDQTHNFKMAICEKRNYYNRTPMGRIAKIFQAFKRFLGMITPLSRAEMIAKDYR
jgi:hypothetical protein